MFTMERLCARIIRLTHTPIRVYDKEGEIVAVYICSPACWSVAAAVGA